MSPGQKTRWPLPPDHRRADSPEAPSFPRMTAVLREENCGGTIRHVHFSVAVRHDVAVEYADGWLAAPDVDLVTWPGRAAGRAGRTRLCW